MMKNKSAGFYCNILAVILEILGIICFAVMAMDGEAAPATVYACGIVGIALQAYVLFTVSKKGDNRSLDFVGMAISVVYALTFVLMIQARVGVITNIFANHVGTIGVPFILATAALLLAVVAQMVAGFLSMEKK